VLSKRKRLLSRRKEEKKQRLGDDGGKMGVKENGKEGDRGREKCEKAGVGWRGCEGARGGGQRKMVREVRRGWAGRKKRKMARKVAETAVRRR
jgi:hypothetical protein